MKAKLTTREAEQLIKLGWHLKQHKSPGYGHVYYMHDEVRVGWPGSAKFINKTIADELVRRGYHMYDHIVDYQI